MAADYLRKAFDPKTLKKIAKATHLIFKSLDADIIVARGLSGSVVAAAVGAMYGVPFAIVRKPSEGSHSSAVIEASTKGYQYKHWLIVDDFIVSGATVKSIAEAIGESKDFTGKCKGIVLYNDSDTFEKWYIDADTAAQIFRVKVS